MSCSMIFSSSCPVASSPHIQKRAVVVMLNVDRSSDTAEQHIGKRSVSILRSLQTYWWCLDSSAAIGRAYSPVASLVHIWGDEPQTSLYIQDRDFAMILLPNQWHDFYNGIREDQHTTSEKKISIFVNGTDCDSLCSLKLLQAILMASQSTCSTFVVNSLGDLKAAFRQEFGKGVRDYRTAFCINCGATSETSELLQPLDVTARECVRLVIIDSHRPIHHSFNDEQDQNCVLLHHPDGGDVPIDDIPLADSFFSGGHAENRSQTRRRIDEDGAHVTGEMDVRALAVQRYYETGSHYGIPASMLLFQLAHEMQLGGNYLLWMAALGLSEQFMLRRVHSDTSHYVHCLEQLENHAEALAAGDREQGLFGDGFDSDDEEEASRTIGATTSAPSKSAQGRIMRSDESVLLLHRHWSLIDAITHAPELMSRIGTFREGSRGRTMLLSVLAAAGVPVSQAQLQFSQMKVQFKTDDTLKEILGHLTALMSTPAKATWVPVYRSFTVEYTSKLTLSAADHVHILWALLINGAQQTGARLDYGFWDAYKATDIRSKQVAAGLSMAMAQHRQLLTDVAMADPNHNLADGIVHEQHGAPGQLLDLSQHAAWATNSPLVHPLSLIRLGIVLQDKDAADAPGRSDWRYRPIVCVGPPDSSGICSAAALPGQKKVQKHPDDAEVYTTWLAEAWQQREAQVWHHEGLQGLLERAQQ